MQVDTLNKNHLQFGNEMKFIDYLNIFCSLLSVFIIFFTFWRFSVPSNFGLLDCFCGESHDVVFRCSLIVIYLLISWIINESKYISVILFDVFVILGTLCRYVLRDNSIFSEKYIGCVLVYFSIFLIFLICSMIFIIKKRQLFSYNIGILHFVIIMFFLIFFILTFVRSFLIFIGWMESKEQKREREMQERHRIIREREIQRRGNGQGRV